MAFQVFTEKLLKRNAVTFFAQTLNFEYITETLRRISDNTNVVNVLIINNAVRYKAICIICEGTIIEVEQCVSSTSRVLVTLACSVTLDLMTEVNDLLS